MTIQGVIMVGSRNETEEEKLKQTGLLLGAANLLLWPFYYADARLGASASVVTSIAMLGLFHEVGKERREVRLNNNTLFSQEGPIQKTVANILEGGATFRDELLSHSVPK